ncbi:glycosyltransferase family 8 protein [Mangrovicoccus ximenensis]
MVKEWISFGTYFRWVLPNIFADEYRTLFYLDTDTYQRRPGLQTVFDTIAPDVPLAAVTELIRPANPGSVGDTKFKEKLRDLGGRNGEYYNAGVLVMQPEPFLAMDGLRRFQDAAVRNVEFMPLHRDQDQGAMNLAFADDIVPMSPLYNWRTRDWMNPRFTEEYDPVVLHFAGPLKPWDRHDNPFFRMFEPDYLEYLSREFPEFERKTPHGSAAWRYENPRHKIKLFEHIRVALYRRRAKKKFLRTWYGRRHGREARGHGQGDQRLRRRLGHVPSISGRKTRLEAHADRLPLVRLAGASAARRWAAAPQFRPTAS